MYKKNYISSNDLKKYYGSDRIYVTGFCSPVVEGLKAKGIDPSYYNSGKYGWNYDVYDVVDKKTGKNVAIVSGYRVPDSLSKKSVSDCSADDFKAFWIRNRSD